MRQRKTVEEQANAELSDHIISLHAYEYNIRVSRVHDYVGLALACSNYCQ